MCNCRLEGSQFLEVLADLIRNHFADPHIQAAGNYAPWSWLVNALSQRHRYSRLYLSCHLLHLMLLNTSENAREHQRVVYLVLEVTSSATIDECPVLFGLLRQNLGHRVGHGKYDWLLLHFMEPFPLQCSSCGDSDEDISTFDYILKGAFLLLWVGDGCQLSFGLIHAFCSTLIDGPLGVTDYHILVTVSQNQFGNGNSCCSCPIDHYFYLRCILSYQLQGVYEGCQSHNCSPMLVIVKNRQQILSLQPLLHSETLRSFYVFKVYSHKISNCLGNKFHFLLLRHGVHAEGHYVHLPQQFEKEGLAFHDWQTCNWADVSKSQDGCTIGDYGSDFVYF